MRKYAECVMKYDKSEEDKNKNRCGRPRKLSKPDKEFII